MNPQNKHEEPKEQHKRYQAVFEGWLMVPRKSSGEINHNTTSLAVPAPRGPFTIEVYSVDGKWRAKLLPVDQKFSGVKLNKDRQVVTSTVESYFEKKVSDWVAIPD